MLIIVLPLVQSYRSRYRRARLYSGSLTYRTMSYRCSFWAMCRNSDIGHSPSIHRRHSVIRCRVLLSSMVLSRRFLFGTRLQPASRMYTWIWCGSFRWCRRRRSRGARSKEITERRPGPGRRSTASKEEGADDPRLWCCQSRTEVWAKARSRRCVQTQERTKPSFILWCNWSCFWH